MSSSDDLFYYNYRRTIAVWCWAQMDATIEGVTHVLLLLTVRNLLNAGIPLQLQGWGPGFHRDGGSLFLERLFLYHAARLLHLVHDFSHPRLILEEGRQPGQVWPAVLRSLRIYFFPEQPTPSPRPVPSRRRAAPAQPISIAPLPTILEASSDEELFEYQPRWADHRDAPPSVTESEVSESEQVEEDVEEAAEQLIFGPISPNHSPRPDETMAIADEDLHGSELPMTPNVHSPHGIFSLDEELSGPMSPPTANPVMFVTFPDDDEIAPIPPVEINEVVHGVDHFPPLPPVVITEILDEEELFPPLPPVTFTEIFLDSN